MKPGLHYDPRKTTTYTADRTTQRLLLALHAAANFPLEHFDIESAYLHEHYVHPTPVYVIQMPKFDCTSQHQGKYGQRIGNLYGTPPAAYYYNQGLQQFHDILGFKKSENYPCLYTLHNEKATTMISTIIDGFLVLATHITLINKLYDNFQKKYNVKRLGFPSRFLNWTITRSADGVHISHPDSIDALLHETKMQDCNATQSPYFSITTLDQHEPTTTLNSEEATRFRKII